MQDSSGYREWNRLHDTMKAHHAFLESRFAQVYEEADKHALKSPSLRHFLGDVIALGEDLRLHQNTEDQGLYPERMPEFAEDRTDEHRKIEEGLGQLSSYLESVLVNPRTYSPVRLRAIMDGMREALFTHMANEVESLQGHNLMRHYTLEELRRLPV